MAPDSVELVALGGAALIGSFVAAVAGGGAGVLLLPLLVLYFGIHVAAPIVTIAIFTASASRSLAYRRELELPVVLWFSLGSVPLTLVGTYVFTIVAPDILTRLLGGFLVLAVLWRRLRPGSGVGPGSFSPRWFLPIGAVFGFLTGISAAVAMVLSPFYLGYGLRKGAFVGTVAMNIFLVQIAKLTVFGARDFLLPEVLLYGVSLVPFMVLGTYAGKRAMMHISERAFVLLVETVMFVAGVGFLIRGAG